MVHFDAIEDLEKAAVFAYGNICRQRERTGFQEIRVCYYVKTGDGLRLVGQWDRERQVGFLTIGNDALEGARDGVVQAEPQQAKEDQSHVHGVTPLMTGKAMWI